MPLCRPRFVLAGILVIAACSPVLAQAPVESTGARALGMAGAFVGVADDGSAAYWNPAGLPALGIFEASLEYGAAESEGPGSGTVGDTAAWRQRVASFRLSTPVLAFSYERMRFGGVPHVAAEEPLALSGAALHAHSFGLTLVQSIGDAVVIGSTVRLVRAGALESPVDPGADASDAARRIAREDVDARTHFDADVGVMASLGRVRLGAVVRNLAAPVIETDDRDIWRFERHARIGASIGGEPSPGQRDWAVAVDADLTTATLPDGRRRSLAAGAERWWGGRRFALRGGGRVQTVDAARPAASAGLSLALRSGVFLDAHATRGDDRRDRGWGAALRLTF
jgi:hypothetical protein